MNDGHFEFKSAFTHYIYAIRDMIGSVSIPEVEFRISGISRPSSVVSGEIVGF